MANSKRGSATFELKDLKITLPLLLIKKVVGVPFTPYCWATLSPWTAVINLYPRCFIESCGCAPSSSLKLDHSAQPCPYE